MNKPLEIIKRPGQLRVERTRALKRIRIKPSGNSYRAYCDMLTLIERKWTEDAEIELQINLVGILQALGERAIKSKTGKSSFMHGLVKAIVRKRTESNVREINHEIPEGFEEMA